MNEPNDFLDQLSSEHPADRHLVGVLRTWRASKVADPAQPDARLESMFSSEPGATAPAKWRQWMRRPAIAFAASFAAVLVVGVGALALVADDPGTATVASPSSSIAAAADLNSDGLAQVTLPEDLSEQTGYATCVAGQISGWLDAGFAADAAPRFVDICGVPPIPDLGPEADAYRLALQDWATCIAEEIQSKLPDLPGLMQDGGDHGDLEFSCGSPPDPADFGVELPFLNFDWENFDPSQLNFGPFNFGDFQGFGNLEDLDLDKLLENLPDGLIPEDFDLEQWRSRLGNFDVESCVPQELPTPAPGDKLDLKLLLGDLGDCDLSQFFPFDLEGLDLENLDLESLLGGLDLGDLDFGDFSVEGLDGVDLQRLLDSLLGGDFNFDLGSLLQGQSTRNA